ncbi:MAG: tetratricopeptide repeat protein, partial [Akkermansiaceae bacterium]|nr:tetratricopeptide repeat protein [Armatimonadota bacterium]
LLPDDLRGSFAALSVFRGGWFTEAAQQIIGGDAVPSLRDQLARLQEHSLVIADTVRDPASDEGATRVRFRLLDTLREFAADQMTRDEKHALAERHAAHYLQLAENAAPHLTGHQQRRWMDVLEAEHNNLRAALTHYDASGNAASGLRLAVALRHFWNRRGYLREACEFLALFLGHFSASPAPEGDRMWQEATGRNALGRALRAAGNIAAGHHEQEIALEIWQRLRHNRGIATTLLEIGIGTYLQGNAPEATLLIENSLKLAREANDLTTVAGAMMNLGNIAISQHELALARQYYQDCLPLARSEDSAWLLASTLNNLGEISRLQGDLAAATLFYEEALRGARVLDNRLSNVLPLLNLAEIARLTGDLTRSETLIHESLTLVRNLGDVYMTAQCLFAAAALANAAQKPERAATILGAVTALQSAMAAWLDVSGPEDQQRLADSLRATLGDTRFQIALAGGAAYPPDRIITFALSGESTL